MYNLSFVISLFCWWPSWNMGNSMSAHLVAASSHGRLKECNQIWARKVFFFFWIKLAIYRYLTRKWTLQLQNFFRVIRFKNWLCEHPRSFHCQILRCHFWLKLDLEESCYIELCRLKTFENCRHISKLRCYVNVDILITPYYSIIYPFLTYDLFKFGVSHTQPT